MVATDSYRLSVKESMRPDAPLSSPFEVNVPRVPSRSSPGWRRVPRRSSSA